MALNAFVIRPFGVKEILVSPPPRAVPTLDQGPGAAPPASARVETVEGSVQRIILDFEAVHRDLIDPALQLLRIRGETTEAVVTAGNIREDMFHRLLTADLVIADVSIHNVNVFYELGIRQAFRDKYTFLVRCDLSDYPFDLKTDRYFEYSTKNPAQSVDRLAAALRATVSSSKADSPVFKLLPKLEAEDRSRFIVVPEEFREEVERARKYYRPGDLRLLAMEAKGYLWEIEGLREVGRAQFELNYIDGARLSWEEVIDRYPDDVEANAALSTIYQRLNDVARSEQALARVSRSGMLTAGRLSQVRGLQARNLKARWVQAWREGPADEWQERALRSPLLQRANDAYEESFRADLNNAYAGLNALGLLITQTDLAMRNLKVWTSLQRYPADAERALEQSTARVKTLIAAVALAVEAERERLRREGAFDCWFEILQAAVECIVSEQPERVVQMYQDAMLWAPGDAARSMRQSLQIYKDLGVGDCEWGRSIGIGAMGINIERAISVIRDAQERQRSDRPDRIVVFVGLRLDPQDGLGEVGRGSGRLPAEAEELARAAIRAAVEAERGQVAEQGGRILFGMAGGAGGGDILFHQVCEELGIETSMYLALPREPYIGEYVAPAGPEWIEHFLQLHRCRKVGGTNGAVSDAVGHRGARINVLADSRELPRWLQGKPLYNIGRRINIWMLQHALVQSFMHDEASVTLIVLWDHVAGDGVGWFADLMALAARHGIKVRRIDRDQWRDG